MEGDGLLQFRARVRVLVGNRGVCDVISKSDMGITGVGVPEIMVITYDPGEIVTRARVEKALDYMIKASDEEGAAWQVLNYEIQAIELVEEE